MSILHVSTGIDLDRTEWGYAYRSTADLRWAYWLFRLLRWGAGVRVANTLGETTLRLGLPVEGLLRRTLGRLFLGGETLEEALSAAQKLHQHGLQVLLDYAVESSVQPADQQRTYEVYRHMIEFAGANRESLPAVAIKLTALAAPLVWEQKSQGSLSKSLLSAYERAFAWVQALAKLAHEKRVVLMIDAEESWLQPAIDELIESLMATYNQQGPILYMTVQMYRRDRLAYLEELLKRARGYIPGIKLVRGAYVEKERRRAQALGLSDPIHPDKASTDMAYDQGLFLCLEALETVGLCVATHNRTSCMKAAQFMILHKKDRAHPHLSFSQLYGMADPLSFGLARAGFRVMKYLPFGPIQQAFPYLARRAEENSSLSDQSGRELRWIAEELARRSQDRTKT